MAEARQETPFGQASSAGVEGRRTFQAEYVRLSALFCLLVGWLVCLLVCLFVRLSVWLFVCCLFVCLFVCVFVCMLASFFVCLVLFLLGGVCYVGLVCRVVVCSFG